MPAIAKAELTISLEKCNASAASASLFVVAAIRFRERQRAKSTMIEAIKTPKTRELASIFVAWPASRVIASIRIKTASANKKPVSTKAANASTLAWPN